jgi:Cu(I)/Ag(I) efflux system membrane protein CusA/SilA
MINRIIDFSVRNRPLIFLLVAVACLWGWWAMQRVALDAIPDLSETQVIVYSRWDRSPDLIEDQVTYPIVTAMLGAPRVKTVRGFSDFGYSFVYVIFEDKTDLYWARSRTLEYLSSVISRLPEGVQTELGPDATGLGWVYQYALVDESGQQSLADLRSLQDWHLRYYLKALPGVAEVATVGGFVRQYQVNVDPNRLRAYNIPIGRVAEAVRSGNVETGGRVIEFGGTEYMVRGRGYAKTLEDFGNIALAVSTDGTPVRIRDIGEVTLGPDYRRGVADLDGKGEVVSGIVVMRQGQNALTVIDRVKARLKELEPSLPPGVKIVPVYDRSELIRKAIATLKSTLIEVIVTVSLVIFLFLWHPPSALVPVITIPVAVLITFIPLQGLRITANIMSLGGIAIAIGAMVDAAIVMIENAHKHLEAWYHRNPGQKPKSEEYFTLMGDAAAEVGPALFFSLLIITVSFLPVFTLEAQEGRLFAPLAFTKTYAMAASAGLAVTLIPVLMGYFIRGKIPSEEKNPINRFFIAIYRPMIHGALARPRLVIAGAMVALAVTWYPVSRIGGEFIPPLNEGDLLYMPSALPGLSPAKAAELLQLSDRMIKTVPEVKTVFGKIGRADTATDPAPLTMIETTIQLKDESEWRPGMTVDKIIAELDRAVKIPSLTNLWIQPIRNRIDMQATGIKSLVGVKVAGADLNEIERIGTQIESVLKELPDTASAFSERVAAGRYVNVKIDRVAAARYGLNVADVQELISVAIGGERVTDTVEGLERYPVIVRFPREVRDSLSGLAALPIVTAAGATVPLSAVATLEIADGPPMLKSENARPNGWIYVDIKGSDLSGYVQTAQQVVKEKVQLPPGYSISWAGQYEFLERAQARLKLVVPMTLMIIFVLLYLIFRNLWQPVMIMATLPFALIGGYWLLYAAGFNMSIAVAVGFIALAGVAAEFGVVMLIYLDHAVARWREEGRLHTRKDLLDAIIEGAVLRVRPKAMTVAVILAGLLPIMLGGGTGSEVMQRIAAPMLGGMISAPLLSMFIIPAFYFLWEGRRLR